MATKANDDQLREYAPGQGRGWGLSIWKEMINEQIMSRELYRTICAASLEDIRANHKASQDLSLALHREVDYFDIVYSPLETVFLRHGRMAGHRTLNGVAMNIFQAVDAFFDKVCRRLLQKNTLYSVATFDQIPLSLYYAW